MNVIQHLKSQGYHKAGEFCQTNKMGASVVLSSTYVKENGCVVVDHQAIFHTEFSYKRYCQKQNEWMLQYDTLFRFIEDDSEMVELFLSDLGHVIDEDGADYISSKTFNREEHSVDPSPLEYYFEDRFYDSYEDDSLSYLSREYSLIMKNGKTGYFDYVLIRNDGIVYGIEENGVSYHHPFIIKEKKYAVILMKQNSLVAQGGKVFRWDTESVQNPVKVVDEIREFFGELTQYKKQTTLKHARPFRLYDHQKSHLAGLHNKREEREEAALVVLPTGTGKSQIVIEDVIRYGRNKRNASILVLVPTRDLKRDWVKNLKDERLKSFQISVKTYSGASASYRKEAQNKYEYLVVDEAHHAVAPGLKKLISYYQPRFLLGLTATDKRLDEKKLEDVFGNYDVQMDLKQAIEQGILCPIRAYRLETNIDLSEVRFNRKDYYASDLQRKIFVPARNELIADTVKKYFGDHNNKKSGVVFCVNIQHAKEMAALLRERGFDAESVDGKDRKRFEKIDRYMNRETQFLCTCSLLTEGWDAPHTEILVMARPTMSRVLYTQQLGRGTRRSPGKDALYVIDVVDNYGAYGRFSNRPWSVHALLGQSWYKPFGDVLNPDSEPVEIDTVYLKELKLGPINIHTLQELYEDYLGEEQLARELFVSTSSVKAWVRKGKIVADVDIPMGRTHLRLFAREQIGTIRNLMGLVEHTEEMIVQDFWDFINKGDYSFSYKMAFINALLDHVDESGEADINHVLESYQHFYQKRFEQGLQVDRVKSPYNRQEMIEDKKALKRSMMDNPFEKFERKRFMYYAKDLNRISIHHKIWDELSDNGGAIRLRKKIMEDLQVYFNNI